MSEFYKTVNMKASITIILLFAILFYVCHADMQAGTHITKKPDGGCGAGGNCIKPVLEEKGCIHNGDWYASGKYFKDSCNTCQCTNGRVWCTTNGCIDKRCIHDGKAYVDQSTFKHDCNTCTCRDGQVACTKKNCGNGCYFKGKRYTVGERFKDECDNWCSCTKSGYVGCTKRGCSPRRCMYGGNFYNEGDSVPGTSICENCRCHKGNVYCERKLCKPMLCKNTRHIPGKCCPICVDGLKG